MSQPTPGTRRIICGQKLLLEGHLGGEQYRLSRPLLSL
jgi:hypothetical protein